MAQINRPRKPNDAGELFQMVGAVIGGIAGGMTGGPVGAAKGAATGAALGGTAGNLLGANDQPQGPQPVQSGRMDALARRQKLAETDDLTALRNAEVAVAQLPEPQRQELVPVLTQARILAERRRRGVS